MQVIDLKRLSARAKRRNVVVVLAHKRHFQCQPVGCFVGGDGFQNYVVLQGVQRHHDKQHAGRQCQIPRVEIGNYVGKTFGIAVGDLRREVVHKVQTQHNHYHEKHVAPHARASFRLGVVAFVKRCVPFVGAAVRCVDYPEVICRLNASIVGKRTLFDLLRDNIRRIFVGMFSCLVFVHIHKHSIL